MLFSFIQDFIRDVEMYLPGGPGLRQLVGIQKENREAKLFVFVFTEEAYSHGGLQTRKLGQTPFKSVDQPRSEHWI